MYELALSVHVQRIIKGRSVKQTFVTSPCVRNSILGLLVYEIKASRNKLVKMLEKKSLHLKNCKSGLAYSVKFNNLFAPDTENQWWLIGNSISTLSVWSICSIGASGHRFFFFLTQSLADFTESCLWHYLGHLLAICLLVFCELTLKWDWRKSRMPPQGMSSSFVLGFFPVWPWRSIHRDQS